MNPASRFFYTIEAMLPNDLKYNNKLLTINDHKGSKEVKCLEFKDNFNSYNEALKDAELNQTNNVSKEIKQTIITVYEVKN